jgi:hypothetical protein
MEVRGNDTLHTEFGLCGLRETEEVHVVKGNSKVHSM